MAEELDVCSVTGSSVESPRNTDGNFQVTKLQVQVAGGTKKLQLFGASGLDYTPHPGCRAVKKLIGVGQNAVIATSDKVTPTTNPGEIEFYSYDASWVKKARFKCKANGKIFAGNSATDLLTLTLGLIDVIKAITTAGSPGSHVIDPASKTALENYKTQIRALLDSSAS